MTQSDHQRGMALAAVVASSVVSELLRQCTLYSATVVPLGVIPGAVGHQAGALAV
jgi:hypothetical protein